MVGDFIVCVDRIIASAACFESGNGAGDGFARREEEGSSESKRRENDAGGFNGEILMKKKTKKKKGEGLGMIECRICQEEGEESEMEAPCACNGTLKETKIQEFPKEHTIFFSSEPILNGLDLKARTKNEKGTMSYVAHQEKWCAPLETPPKFKFAHRKCIQRWCNKKGNITCEICNQVYAPNYSAPPARVTSDVIAIDIRQGWGARIDLHDSHFLAIAAAEQELLNSEYEDYAAAHNSGIACCRSVALILMLLLLVHHVLMVMRDAGMVQDASDFFNLSLQFAGFLLPCYLIVRSCYILQSRRRRQV